MLKTGTLVYCEYSYCRILYGVKVGNEKMPIKLFIAFHADIITEIDISVSHYTVAKYFHFYSGMERIGILVDVIDDCKLRYQNSNT